MKGGKTRSEKKGKSFAKRLSEITDIEPEAFATISGVDISIRESSDMTVSVCRSIILYTSNKISLELPRHILTVDGRELTMKSYHDGSVNITGEIDAIMFMTGDRGGGI